MPQFSVYMNYSKLSSKEKSSSFVFFLFDDSPASEFYVPTFRNTLSSICLVLTPSMTMGQSVPKRRHIKFRPKRKNTTFDIHRTVHRNILSIVKPTRCTTVSNLFYFEMTLHVSDGLSVHHQEFKTVHTATDICQTANPDMGIV